MASFDNLDDALALVDRAAAIAPEATILYLIWQVRSNNIATGRNTSVTTKLTPTIAQGLQVQFASDVSAIADAIGKVVGGVPWGIGQTQQFIAGIVQATGKDIGTVISQIKTWLGL